MTRNHCTEQPSRFACAILDQEDGIMNRFIWIVLMPLFLALRPDVVRAGNSDLEIHCAPKKLDEKAAKSSSSGTIIASKERWIYEVTVENKTFKDLVNLDVKYIIFFKKDRLGEKGAAQDRRQNGSFTIDLLQSHKKKTFQTRELELNKSKLSVDFYYPSGGKEVAQDNVNGLWLRVYQNGQQFAEFANPSILTKEQWQ